MQQYVVRAINDTNSTPDLVDGTPVVAIVDADGTNAFQAAIVCDGVLVSIGPWRATEAEAAKDLLGSPQPDPVRDLFNQHMHEVREKRKLQEPRIPTSDDDMQRFYQAGANQIAEHADPQQRMVDDIARRERIPNIDDFLAMGLELKAAGLAMLAHLRGDRAECRALLMVACGNG